MNKRTIGALALLLILVAGCGVARREPSGVPRETASASPGQARPGAAGNTVLQCRYYEQELFLQGVYAPQDYSCGGAPYAVVAPHHLVATDMIAGALALAGEYADSYDRVILIAPSHFPEQCGSDVVTAYASWDTPYGKAEGDAETVGALLKNRQIRAANDPAALEWDHGAAGLIPYIKYYLPNAKVSVCLLSNRLSKERLEQVQQEIIAQHADGRTLLLASLDCSHYQALERAEQYDRETRQAIESGDIDRILHFDDRNIDSPQVLASFLAVTTAGGLELIYLDGSNSAEKMPHAISNPIYYEGVTSYLVYAAYAPEGDADEEME